MMVDLHRVPRQGELQCQTQRLMVREGGSKVSNFRFEDVESWATVRPKHLLDEAFELAPGPSSALEFEVCFDAREFPLGSSQLERKGLARLAINDEYTRGFAIEIPGPSASPLPANQLSAPTNLAITDQIDSVDLAWDPVPGAELYNVYRIRPKEETVFALVGRSDVTEAAISIASHFTERDAEIYKVAAVNAQGESALSKGAQRETRSICEGTRIAGAVPDDVAGIYRALHRGGLPRGIVWRTHSHELYWSTENTNGRWELREMESNKPKLWCTPSDHRFAFDPSKCSPWFESVRSAGETTRVETRAELKCVPTLPSAYSYLSARQLDLDEEPPPISYELWGASGYEGLEMRTQVIQDSTGEVFYRGGPWPLEEAGDVNEVIEWTRAPTVGGYRMVLYVVEPGVDCEAEALLNTCPLAYDTRSYSLDVVASGSFGNGGKLMVCVDTEGSTSRYGVGVSKATSISCTVENHSEKTVRLKPEYDQTLLVASGLEGEWIEVPAATALDSGEVTVKFSANRSSAPNGITKAPVVFRSEDGSEQVTRHWNVDVDERRDRELVVEEGERITFAAHSTRRVSPSCQTNRITLRGGGQDSSVIRVKSVRPWANVRPPSLSEEGVEIQPGSEGVLEIEVCVDASKIPLGSHDSTDLRLARLSLDGTLVGSLWMENSKQSTKALSSDVLPAPVGLRSSPFLYAIDLSWRAVSGAQGYNLYRRAAGTSDPYELVAAIGKGQTSFSDYFFDHAMEHAVRAVNSQGESELSASIKSEALIKPVVATKIAPWELPPRGLIVRFDYPSVKHETDLATWEKAATEAGAYFETMSEGQFRILFDVSEVVVRAPLRPTRKNGYAYEGSGRQAGRDFMTDDFTKILFETADAHVDFSSVDLVLLALPDPNNSFHSYFSPIVGGVRVDGREFSPHVALTESFGWRTIAHETMHWLGLDDMHSQISYYPEHFAGTWDLMGHGKGLSAVSRVELGWVKPRVFVDNQDDVSVAMGEVIQVFVPGSKEHILIENRQKRGPDEDLPGEGIMIWHVSGTEGGRRPQLVKAWEGLGLEAEATGGGTDRETTLFFLGNTAPGYKNRFDVTAEDGTPAGFYIDDFSEPGPVMTFDLHFHER